MPKKPEPIDQSVVVLIPAVLRVIVANAIEARGKLYDPPMAGLLHNLAAKIHEPVATGRAGHTENLYDHLARVTGTNREDVKKILHALAYSPDYLAPEGANSPRTLKALETNKAVSAAVRGRR